MWKMCTNEEKARLSKLLQDLEVAEERLPERCRPLLKDFQEKLDRGLLLENERKLRQLLGEENRTTKVPSEDALTTVDPKRPWRTNSCKEKLLRIESDLKRLKSAEKIEVDSLCNVDIPDALVTTDSTGVQ